MHDLFGTILSPIVLLIKKFYLLIDAITINPFISVVVMSLLMSVFLIPVLQIARRYEDRVGEQIDCIEKKLEEIPNTFKGEERFRAIEKIYNENDFHPIQNIYRGFSLYIILPVLISMYVFFLNNSDLFNISVAGIFNLSHPDQILFGVNLLPLLIFITNFFDSKFRFVGGMSGQNTYLFISLVILILIYDSPLCLTLYWFTGSIFSLALSYFNYKSSKFIV
jgi:membrane protein insertase Oxa1/YidC/SpoIIIJ